MIISFWVPAYFQGRTVSSNFIENQNTCREIIVPRLFQSARIGSFSRWLTNSTTNPTRSPSVEQGNIRTDLIEIISLRTRLTRRRQLWWHLWQCQQCQFDRLFFVISKFCIDRFDPGLIGHWLGPQEHHHFPTEPRGRTQRIIHQVSCFTSHKLGWTQVMSLSRDSLGPIFLLSLEYPLDLPPTQ